MATTYNVGKLKEALKKLRDNDEICLNCGSVNMLDFDTIENIQEGFCQCDNDE